MQISTASRRTVAVLGPTNTGKTHYAMERMLGHDSGMIGFPLRLLARENYDRAVRARGVRNVALITGEEKILPPNARFFLCTVESMPLDRQVAFLGVDEIQMGADPERGHIFTDRLLHARGLQETMFMGAETARPLIRRLVPDAEFDTRPRFSTLRYSGRRKITRLPARSAVVAFSAADVYTIAELIRRQRGGAAVVLGALSPRTRNAQVAMYQEGEVDYLVATDAIGMGLNMDVDHVAFAATRKFDGRQWRDLSPSELAQIAGRAGRHLNDGTFGVTAEAPLLDDETVTRIENHQFEALEFLYWRNARLRFTSVADLVASLEAPPSTRGLVRARQADDERVLSELAQMPDIRDSIRSPDRVQLLWAVCRIPDFGNSLSDAHTRLLEQIFGHLTSPAGRLPTDWVAAQVERLDHTDGEIDALTQRLAHIRTWTYVSFHGHWLQDAGHWQARTRSIEDTLSDALHERLRNRFVDRRTAVLMRRLKGSAALQAQVTAPGRVSVEGHEVGHLEGFRFVPDLDERGHADRTATQAALRALKDETERRVAALEGDGDDAFSLLVETGKPGAAVVWDGAAVGRLAAGADVLAPAVTVPASDLLDNRQRERVRARLADWVAARLRRDLAPLYHLGQVDLGGAARGIAFQVAQALGSIPREPAAQQIAALGREDRRRLRALGLHLGREAVYVPALLKPAPQSLRAVLWTAARGIACPLPPPGRVSLAVEEGVPEGFYDAIGYRPMGGRAVRLDVVERLAARAWALSRTGPFSAGPELMTLAGCGPQDLPHILAVLGYRGVELEGETRYVRHRRPRRPPPAGRRRRPPDHDSPFAKLREYAGS